MPAIIFRCPACGGSEIGADASAHWSVEAQAWVLDGTHDNRFCNGCGADGIEPVAMAVPKPLSTEANPQPWAADQERLVSTVAAIADQIGEDELEAYAAQQRAQPPERSPAMPTPKLWYPSMNPETPLYLRLKQKEGGPVCLWIVNEKGENVNLVAAINGAGRLERLSPIHPPYARRAGLDLDAEGRIRLG